MKISSTNQVGRNFQNVLTCLGHQLTRRGWIIDVDRCNEPNQFHQGYVRSMVARTFQFANNDANQITWKNEDV